MWLEREDLGTSGPQRNTDRQPPQQELRLGERLNNKVEQMQEQL